MSSVSGSPAGHAHPDGPRPRHAWPSTRPGAARSAPTACRSPSLGYGVRSPMTSQRRRYTTGRDRHSSLMPRVITIIVNPQNDLETTQDIDQLKNPEPSREKALIRSSVNVLIIPGAGPGSPIRSARATARRVHTLGAVIALASFDCDLAVSKDLCGDRLLSHDTLVSEPVVPHPPWMRSGRSGCPPASNPGAPPLLRVWADTHHRVDVPSIGGGREERRW
jgi:hypothetical protein